MPSQDGRRLRLRATGRPRSGSRSWRTSRPVAAAVPFHGRYRPASCRVSPRQTAVISFNATATAAASSPTCPDDHRPGQDLTRAARRRQWVSAAAASGGHLASLVTNSLTMQHLNQIAALFDDRYRLAAQLPAS